MTRLLLAIALFAVAAAPACAHFPFLVPDGDSKGRAVFSDTLKPDDRGVPVDRIANTKLAILASGKAAEVTWTLDKSANCYTFEVPGSGPRIVVGTTDYGVLQRGESKPFLLHYYPKAVFGGLPSPEQCTAGDRVKLELIPVAEGSKVRFRALAAGKALARAEVTVIVPGEEKTRVVATDDSGLTPAFDRAGAYGAQVRLVEAKAGEHAGKKYEEVRHYATLVVTLPGK